MSIRYKIDVLAALKEAGYSSARIRNEKILGESYLQQMRRGDIVSWNAIDTVCRLTGLQIGDIVEYVPDSEGDEIV